MLENLEPIKNRVYYCKVDILKDELSEEDYKILIEAVNNKEKWQARTLSRALLERGLKLADTTIGKHRNKECACFR
jgi:PP-loop superfamily ATP-utilizing enzyme